MVELLPPLFVLAINMTGYKYFSRGASNSKLSLEFAYLQMFD